MKLSTLKHSNGSNGSNNYSGIDICGICEKPLPAHEPRFLHFWDHMVKKEAIGTFNKKGEWFFKRVSRRDAEAQRTV